MVGKSRQWPFLGLLLPSTQRDSKNAVSPNSHPITLILASMPALIIVNRAMSTVSFAYEG